MEGHPPSTGRKSGQKPPNRPETLSFYIVVGRGLPKRLARVIGSYYWRLSRRFSTLFEGPLGLSRAWDLLVDALQLQLGRRSRPSSLERRRRPKQNRYQLHRGGASGIEGLDFQAKKSPIEPQHFLSIHFLSGWRPVLGTSAPPATIRGASHSPAVVVLVYRYPSASASGEPLAHANNCLPTAAKAALWTTYCT